MIINIKKVVLLWGISLLLLGIVSGRPNTKKCLKRNGKFPIPGTACTGYYECKNYVPQEKTCHGGEHFNANRGRCDWKELYPCLERQKDKECPKENGLYLKPGTNCKKYYRCCNGKAKEEDCSGNLLFDPSKGHCEWPHLYTCIESSSTTEKVSSTVTSFETSISPDDKSGKSSTDIDISTDNVQKTTSSRQITYSTQDPDFERTNTVILKSSTTTEASTLQPTTTTHATTLQPTTTEASTLEPTTTTQTSTLQSTKTTETSTMQPTTAETSTFEPTTTETSTSDTTADSSTLQSTTSKNPLISQTSSTQISSTHSIHHTIDKEDREGEITEPTDFETRTEKTFPTSTVEVTTSAELNIMCPEPNGYFPHPTDKHKFVGCVNDIPSILTCPSNLVYKHRFRRCDYE